MKAKFLFEYCAPYFALPLTKIVLFFRISQLSMLIVWAGGTIPAGCVNANLLIMEGEHTQKRELITFFISKCSAIFWKIFQKAKFSFMAKSFCPVLLAVLYNFISSGIPFRSHSFRMAKWMEFTPKHGIPRRSSFFRGITKTVQSKLRGIFQNGILIATLVLYKVYMPTGPPPPTIHSVKAASCL